MSIFEILLLVLIRNIYNIGKILKNEHNAIYNAHIIYLLSFWHLEWTSSFVTAVYLFFATKKL